MANSPQARKRARQAEKNRQRNASIRSMSRTYVKKVRAAIDSGDKSTAAEALTKAASVLDKVARKGIITKNKASRLKSRLSAQVKALA